jgi:hypothetical protein
MRPISSEALHLLRQGAPQFVKDVRRTLREGRASEGRLSLTVRLEDFDDDPMLLYAALWYACTEGIAVTVFIDPPSPKR